MSLVRVSRGDEWMSELPWAPNKSLTPITLVVSLLSALPSTRPARPSGSDFAPNKLQGESELIQVKFESCKGVRG